MEVGQALHALPLAVWMRTVPWAYPTVETTHIAALALLFGSVVVVDLRVLGVSKALPLTLLARHTLPFTVLAFTLAAGTGSLLFLAHADELVSNRVFVAKMLLISAAGMNAAVFHTGPYARVAAWDVGAGAPVAARFCAGLSILLWIAVIVCGRWLAYA